MSVKHIRSSVSGKIPTAANLSVGEIAINFADKALYTRDASDNIIELSRDVYKANTSPSGSIAGTLWYDTTASSLKVYNGSSWSAVGTGSSASLNFSSGNSSVFDALTSNSNADFFHVTTDAGHPENDDRVYIYSNSQARWIDITGTTTATLDANYVRLDGAVMDTGATLVLGAAPSSNMDAVTKLYMDSGSSLIKVDTTAPTSPKNGDLWVNNSTSPAVTYVWGGSSWSAVAGSAASIGDFSESVDDRVATLLVAGKNTTLTYDDANNQLTVTATPAKVATTTPTGSATGDLWFNGTSKSLQVYDGSNFQSLSVYANLANFASTSGLVSGNAAYAIDEVNTSLSSLTSGLTETIQDTVGTMMVAGNNVTLSYSDAGGTLTVSAPGMVKTVNGTSPNAAGEILLVTGKVYSGTLANLGAGASASAIEGDNYVVVGDGTSANNGKTYIYNGVTWLSIASTPAPKAYVGPTASPPSTPWAEGDLWWNSDKGVLLIYYNDGTSYQWVPSTPSSVASTGATYAITSQGSGAPSSSASANSGQIYIDTSTNELYYSNGVTWTKSAGSSSGGGTGITFTAAATPPASPALGDEWYNTSTDALYIRINDGTANSWVDITSMPSTFSNIAVTNWATVTNLSVTGTLGLNSISVTGAISGASFTTSGTSTAASMTSTNGYFWANGSAYSPGTTYSNTQTAAYLTVNTANVNIGTGAIIAASTVGTSGQVLTSTGTASQWSTLSRVVLQVAGTKLSPASATTYYFGGNPSLAPIVTAAASRVYVPRAGTIKAAYIFSYVSGTVDTVANNVTFSLRLNNTTDTSIGTLPQNTSQGVLTNTGLSIAVVAGDYFEIKALTPTFTTLPTNIYWSGTIYIE